MESHFDKPAQKKKKKFAVCPAEYKFPAIYNNYLGELHGIYIASLP
jgi:hypothetical protein